MPSVKDWCIQELVIGGSDEIILTVNTTIIPTCLLCFDSNNQSFNSPRFRIDSSLITQNSDVYQI